MTTSVMTCGFECGRTGTGLHVSAVTSAVVSISTVTVRNGDRSLRVNPVSVNNHYATVAAYGNVARKIGRIAIRFAAFPNTATSLVMYDSEGNGPRIDYLSGPDRIEAAVSGAISGGSGVSVSTGIWYFVDFDFNVNTGGNDTCDVRVNGTSVGQASHTGLSATNADLFLGVRGITTADIFYDDFIASETAADYPIGDGYVNHFVPTSDGTHNVAGANDFERGTLGTDILNSTTDAYLLIDEVPLDDTTPDTDDYINMIAPPNATDYVAGKFGPAPGISTPTVGPRAVECIIGIHQAGTGAGNMRIRLADIIAGLESDIYSATGIAGTTILTYKRAHFANALSGAAWNITPGIADSFIEIQIRLGSPAAVDANPDQYLDCAMIEAEFAVIPKSSIFQRRRSQAMMLVR
jgi:hypothetical protein